MIDMFTNFCIGIFFGIVGFGFFQYGRKATQYTHMIVGIMLMLYPYFIQGTFLIIFVGCVLTLSPFFIQKYFDRK